MTATTNSAHIDGIEYKVLKCYFDEDVDDQGNFYMEILVDRNDNTPSNRYPFGNGFLFTIDVPPVHLTRSAGAIAIDFDIPDQDSCVSVYTGEHDGLVEVHGTLTRSDSTWTLQLKGRIDLVDEMKEFYISCFAVSCHGSKFMSISWPG